MEPPSYEEARRHPPQAIPPPPSYIASIHSPSTPPPTYGEAVTIQPDPFPVLTLPSVPTAATSHSQNSGIIIHPVTQIGATPSVSSSRAPIVAVVTQPQPVPISMTCLSDSPGMVRCPHCHHIVTTKVTNIPGPAAWCLCLFLCAMGLICGFCLIPFMVRGLQDAHHSCPHCGNHLYTYKR